MYRLFKFFIVCAALLLACPSFAKDRRPRPPAVPGGAAVTVTKAKTTCFADALSLTGVLLPRAEVLVRPDQEGMQITQVLADIGDTVKSGQTLVQLARPDGQGGVSARRSRYRRRSLARSSSAPPPSVPWLRRGRCRCS